MRSGKQAIPPLNKDILITSVLIGFGVGAGFLLGKLIMPTPLPGPVDFLVRWFIAAVCAAFLVAIYKKLA
jgi:hypothetical protein